MTFVALILKNIVRQRTRTFLTVLGISLGITTVVALGVVTESLKASSGEILKLGGADFMVAQEGAADLSFSIVPEDDIPAIAATAGVASTEGILFHIARVGSNPFFFFGGREHAGIVANPPPIREGAVWDEGATNQVMLGVNAAKNLGAGIGDTVTIEDREFKVAGIYQTGMLYEDAGGYAPLSAVQEIAGKTGVVTAVFVHLEPGADPETVGHAIEDRVPGVASIIDVGDYGKVDQGIQMLDAANLAISVLAVGIGAIGVMNTMIMSVFERTREIGILRAVGWSGRRILRMIISESLVLCVLAAGVGSALGVLATRAILLIDTVKNLLEPQYTLDIFVRALVVAVVVALAGAAYPAFRAVRLTPMAALRYE
ncbi:MAG TPA: ABC transporter permease [Dehalococcoidia bacterium]|nr:ABC transporter permease [Dehalococcoidia bacterium]